MACMISMLSDLTTLRRWGNEREVDINNPPGQIMRASKVCQYADGGAIEVANEDCCNCALLRTGSQSTIPERAGYACPASLAGHHRATLRSSTHATGASPAAGARHDLHRETPHHQDIRLVLETCAGDSCYIADNTLRSTHPTAVQHPAVAQSSTSGLLPMALMEPLTWQMPCSPVSGPRGPHRTEPQCHADCRPKAHSTWQYTSQPMSARAGAHCTGARSRPSISGEAVKCFLTALVHSAGGAVPVRVDWVASVLPSFLEDGEPVVSSGPLDTPPLCHACTSPGLSQRLPQRLDNRFRHTVSDVRARARMSGRILTDPEDRFPRAGHSEFLTVPDRRHSK
ncbi:hypothetical protein DPEC_G00361810 [Dallia pectoralis]|nr:hypothetical protein DPEC_G00361810 [Dallia pectoralis]